MIIPPSTAIAWPVMKRAASLARNTITGAMSRSGSPRRPPSGITYCMVMCVDRALLLGHAGTVRVVHGRPDRGYHCVDGDGVARPLLRDGPRPSHHGGLRRRVVRRPTLAADRRA